MSGLCVYTANSAITADLARSGIAKSKINEAEQYAYRGIDDDMESLTRLRAFRVRNPAFASSWRRPDEPNWQQQQQQQKVPWLQLRRSRAVMPGWPPAQAANVKRASFDADSMAASPIGCSPASATGSTAISIRRRTPPHPSR
jgi:hypothetical protein